MDVAKLKQAFVAIQNAGIYTTGILRNAPSPLGTGSANISMKCTWINLKAEEKRTLYGCSADYAGSVMVPYLGFNAIDLEIVIDGASYRVINCQEFSSTATRLDLVKGNPA